MIKQDASVKTPRIFSASFGSIRLKGLLPIFLSLGLFLTLVSAAAADGRIGAGDGKIIDDAKPGGISGPASVAVNSKEGGAVYVLDGGNDRVSEFEPSGAFIRAFGWGIVPGAASGTGELTAGSAVVSNMVTTSGSFLSGGAGGRIVTGPGIAPGTEVLFATATELKLSEPAIETRTSTLSAVAGPGNIPVNEVQAVAAKATSGEFNLTFTSPKPGTATLTTGGISATATGAQVQSALEALPNIGAGNVSVSGGPGNAEGTSPYLVEFKGKFADTNVRKLTAAGSNLAGGTPSSTIGVTTPVEGGGAMETCTAICTVPSAEENAIESGSGFGGSQPGRISNSDEIAIDNDPTSPSYGDVYVLDQNNYRIEKYSPAGELLLIFGGGVDHTTGADVCTAADIAAGDVCGAGVPGTGPAHFYKEEPPTTAGHRKAWSNSGSNSLAVGADGTVYVGDYGRIQEFKPDGTFAGEFKLPDAEPMFVTALAVDAKGNIYERSEINDGGATIFSQAPGIREFSAAHALVRSFDTEGGSEPTHVALGEGGDLVVSDFNGGSFEFRQFKPSGTLDAVFTSDQVISKFRTEPHGIAVQPEAGKLYAAVAQPEGQHVAVVPIPKPGPPVVEEETAANILPKTATVRAVVNPSGFDTKYRFEYIDEAGFQSGGFSNPATQSTTTVNLGSVGRRDPVQAALSDLETATKYHFRAVAESHCNEAIPSEVCVVDGSDETFETLPPVSIAGFTTQTVGPELVTLKAELNPNGPASHYTFRIGTNTEYLVGSVEGELAAGNEFVERTATIPGLLPDTTYHYELVASNEYGQTSTGDRTFMTEESSAEERASESCSNTILREENGSLGLADCRAYEQVSERNKAGGEAFPITSFAPGGERLLYQSEGVFAGAVSNELTIEYLAQRTASGWRTMPVISRPAPAGTEPLITPNQLMFSPELDRWLFDEVPAFDHLEALFKIDSAYLTMGTASGEVIAHATPTFSLLEGEPRQVFYLLNTLDSRSSEDLSHIYSIGRTRLLESDPRPDDYGHTNLDSSESSRIYELTGVGTPGATMSLAAEVPLGLNPNEGCAISGAATGAQHGGEKWVSADGSVIAYIGPIEKAAGKPCGEGQANPLALFIHQGEGPSVQLNVALSGECHAPAPCATGAISVPAFDGISPDGKRVWFTTTQPLVDADTDGTSDLYVAELEGGELREIVQATKGQASADHPTPGAGADVQGVVRVSADGTHVAFVAKGVLTTSPSPSTGLKARQGADNLYVYDAGTGELKFVSWVCSGQGKSGSAADSACTGSGSDAGLWRLENHSAAYGRFTPSGQYMLFPAVGRLTEDDTDNVSDLYRYEFETGELLRVSSGRRGNDGNGNDNKFEVELPALGEGQAGAANEMSEDSTRVISADGATIIFETKAPLVSSDTNEAADVYEWEEQGRGTCVESPGCVSLISDGVDPHGAGPAVIGSSGRDITFHSQRSEIPADTDGVGDIYDARVNGGFPTPVPSAACRTAEACKPAIEPAPGAPNMSTSEFQSGGNGPQELRCAKGKHRVTKHGQVRCVSRKRRHHHATKHRGRSAKNHREGSK